MDGETEEDYKIIREEECLKEEEEELGGKLPGRCFELVAGELIAAFGG